MEIGWPTDVQHVNHVTFDRFDGFLGLPVEFEPEVPRRAPSASATVFGVSTESMQLSYDVRGNSIRLSSCFCRGICIAKAEGIFRITAGNSQEEYVRDQLNRGVIPEGIDVHCLAGLIKAFTPTEAALLDWAINLMADVVQEEHLNKMNARNVAMVFAPNMTQCKSASITSVHIRYSDGFRLPNIFWVLCSDGDPLTALMYAVQVMNFLKTLIEKTLREREDSVKEPAYIPHIEPSDDNGNQSFSQVPSENPAESNEEPIQTYLVEDPGSDSGFETNQVDNITDEDYLSYSTSAEESD
ncbi:hypothetical protein DH2020_024552 [Rehmannia glutinosa]|uniref:CRIB domain-containing protein n=1 Tax=Rehmannia glutinosa TaxID=99300 RepID=A0ABR0W5U5_REHGL